LHTTGLVDVGTVKLYAEVVGDGPTLMFITGATGDAGEWGAIAPALAGDFTVLMYDRRGLSRSPRPDGWTATTIAEQAEDAAGLLRGVGLAPALVVGHSGGGSIACELVTRHPDLVRHAVIYEPPLFAAVPGGHQVAAQMRAAVEPILREQGHRQAMRVFLGASVTDEAAGRVFASMSQPQRDRVLDNGAVFLPIELPVFASYLPDPGRVAASGVPMTVVVGEDSRNSWIGAAAEWLASQTGASLAQLPGDHIGFHTHPEEFIALIRRIDGPPELRAQRNLRSGLSGVGCAFGRAAVSFADASASTIRAQPRPVILRTLAIDRTAR
jgi:pimeloyl-ACP methyl ester carboxylesterase